MVEAKNIVETIVKMKAFGYFLVFWGATFFFKSISDFAYYAYNYGAAGFSETIAETASWIIYDIVAIGAAITLWIIAIKVLQAKN
jgi:hypothetical protein